MPSPWLPNKLPKIKTDLELETSSSQRVGPHHDSTEAGSSSSSCISSLLETPSTPPHARYLPYSKDDSDGFDQEAVHLRGGSSRTLKPFTLARAHSPPDLADRGIHRHSHKQPPRSLTTRHPITGRPTPFAKREEPIGPIGHANWKAARDARRSPATSSDNCSRPSSLFEDPPNQPITSTRPTSPTLLTIRNHLPFPRIRLPTVRSGFKESESPSSSYATSQPRSAPGEPSRQDSQRTKHKLGPHRFLVSRKVGEGGFGRVYKGIEIHSGQTVAIKTVSRKGLSRSRVDATLKEQKVARRIAKSQRDRSSTDGEFVVRMLASFLTPNHFVFIWDYHGAGDLRDVDLPLGPDHARFYVGEIALGLRFIHSLDIVMRDLKPANVLLGYDGHIRLADFGLAAMSEPSTELMDERLKREPSPPRPSFSRTRTISLGSSTFSLPIRGLGRRCKSKPTANAPKFFGKRPSKVRENNRRCPIVFCGTPGYISPEGYQGRYGPENDMWALGITLYEFITGQNPFDMWGNPTTEIQKKVLDSEIFYPEGMPATTRDIISKLLRRRWQKRITIDEMMEHAFFQTEERFWVRLEKRQLTPPPLPDVAMRRLSQSAENMSLRTQVPLILHLEGENMDSTSRFVEQLEAQQLNDFEMDGLDALTPLTEEKRDNEAW